VDLSRRNLLRGKNTAVTPSRRLPWVISEAVFIDNCSRCDECIDACPEKIIVKGDAGFPTVDFGLGECTFCQECIKVCEQPLFTAHRANKAWQTSLTFLDSCLAKSNVYCQSCQDVCDVDAISFVYAAGSTPQPQINLEDCTGCGACVIPCPANAIDLTQGNI